MARIVLTTIGTLGDLHPFIAIALDLRRRGHRPVMAVSEDHVAKVRAAGLEAVAVLPSFDTVWQRMGLSEEEAVARVMASQRTMLEEVILPWLESSTDALDAVCADADAIVASLFVFGATVVAEKRGIPLISVILQPMAMLSAHQPPHTPDFWMMKGEPESAIGWRWNQLVYKFARRVMRRRYGRKLDRVRARHGLEPLCGISMFEIGQTTTLTLCCYSPAFGPAQVDAPPQTAVVGFPIYDSASGCDAPDAEMAAFLDAGPPPLVFTLGSFAVFAPGDFYQRAAVTARRLGRRAILLTGGKSQVPGDHDILVRDYAPHSQVFPRAAAVIHHGGIGTTGQALRAGKPQLVVPHMGDQADNAHRVHRLHVGRVLAAKRFNAERAAKRIAWLLDAERPYLAASADLGATIAAEDGARGAGEAIERVVGHGEKPPEDRECS